MPQINITENSANLINTIASQASSHISVFFCGETFYNKLVQNENPVPVFKQYNTPQELISEFDISVLAGTSSGLANSTLEKGFSGGTTLDRELHSALNYLEYGGILIAATGATQLGSVNIQFDSAFYERREKFLDVIAFVNIFEDVIGIVGSSFEYRNGSDGDYPTTYSGGGFGILQLTGIAGSTFDNQIFSVLGRKERNRLYGGETANIRILMTSDAAGCIARTDSEYYPWYAPAGTVRGQINSFTKLIPALDDNDITTLQTQSVNAFNNIVGLDGAYLLGDKTCETTSSSNKTQLGVTRLVNYMGRAFKHIISNSLFELNDAETRSKIVTSSTAVMEFIKSGRGVSSYSIICDETNNTLVVQEARQIVVDLSFKPVFSVNEVSFRFVINQS